MAATTGTLSNQVQIPAVPNLPIPPTEYDQDYTNRFNNVLRLYFNQLNNVVAVNTNSIASNSVIMWLNQ
jgi:hypothetical protein